VTGAVERAVRKDLRRLPVADRGCTLAASALTLARLLDEADEVDADKRLSSAAQAARELRGTITELMKGAPKARSGIDDLRARRAARAAAG
jgi:hypothetical protein